MHLNQALQIHPDYAETVYYLALNYQKSGNIEESKRFYKKYLEIEKDPEKKKQAQDRLSTLIK